ncbi:hypothetical protein BT93_E1662 [Corymbia citriodora subsp. variegata]|nr:hypothetical protein BT93_E1662 [Corymbia citriodora subsp. variegata]
MVRTSMHAAGRHDYEDYISLLPDCVIHHIFFLPTEDVIKTCLLSRRWRYVWTTISDLRGHYWSPLLYNCCSLTKLCLRGCRFSSSESVSDDVLRMILMGSPVLEYFNLIRCQGVKRIHSRSLRELVIDDVLVMEFTLEISTPCVLLLHVRGDYFREMIRIIEAPSLVNAELDFDSQVKSDYSLLKQMLCKLQNATQILLGDWCLRVMWPWKVENVQVSLPNCKSLMLHIPFRQYSFPAIANMLATTPNLEKLIIIFEPSDWCDQWVYSLNSNPQV